MHPTSVFASLAASQFQSFCTRWVKVWASEKQECVNTESWQLIIRLYLYTVLYLFAVLHVYLLMLYSCFPWVRVLVCVIYLDWGCGLVVITVYFENVKGTTLGTITHKKILKQNKMHTITRATRTVNVTSISVWCDCWTYHSITMHINI